MTDAAHEVIHLRIPSRLELLGLLDRVAMLRLRARRASARTPARR